MKLLAASAVALSVLGFSGAAQAQQPGKLFFEGDIVRGNQAGAPGPFCVLANQFRRLEKVVWRIRILDQAGKISTARDSRASSSNCPTGRRWTRASVRTAALARRGDRSFLDRNLDHPGELSVRHLRLQGDRDGHEWPGADVAAIRADAVAAHGGRRHDRDQEAGTQEIRNLP